MTLKTKFSSIYSNFVSIILLPFNIEFYDHLHLHFNEICNQLFLDLFYC